MGENTIIIVSSKPYNGHPIFHLPYVYGISDPTSELWKTIKLRTHRVPLFLENASHCSESLHKNQVILIFVYFSFVKVHLPQPRAAVCFTLSLYVPYLDGLDRNSNGVKCRFIVDALGKGAWTLNDHKIFVAKGFATLAAALPLAYKRKL